VISFDHVNTRNRTQHKDELAKSIAEADGVTEGIICLISAVESCWSFQARKRYATGKLELFRRERKCLHHYLCLIDPEFGFMRVRIQGLAGSRINARSTSTAASGWPAGSTRLASAMSAGTTRCWLIGSGRVLVPRMR
jgi:hypothetical protein